MKLTRRDILHLGLGASALAFAPIRLYAEGVCPKSVQIGLQFYSVREIGWKDLPKSFEILAAMGYKGIEFAGTRDVTAKDMKKMLADAGLKCCGSHIPESQFEGDALKQTIAYFQELETKFLTVPWLNFEKNIDAWKTRADWFNKKSELCQKDGMFIGYHNHSHEFDEHVYDGVTGWEILFRNTDDAVLHQMDTGNCAGGGEDPVKFIRMFPGRTKQVHAKEYPWGKMIGKGSLDWKEIVSAATEVGGAEWFIIEAEKNPDSFDDSEACIKGLKEFL